MQGRNCLPRSTASIAMRRSERTGPSFGRAVGNGSRAAGGARVKFDENYIRESIIDPEAKVCGLSAADAVLSRAGYGRANHGVDFIYPVLIAGELRRV